MIDEQAGQSTPAPTPDKLTAPWDDRTVAALNAFQAGGYLHPFTCPREHFTSGEVKLFATNEGWVCTCAPACGYTQDWAHAVMADPKARASLHPALSASPSGENTTPVGAEGGDDSSTAQGACEPFCFCGTHWTPEQQREAEIRHLAFCEASVQASADPEAGEQCPEPRQRGSVYCERHTEAYGPESVGGLSVQLPLPDSETEWGYRRKGEPDEFVRSAATEAVARDVVQLTGHPGDEWVAVQRTAPGPWIEVTS